MKLVTLHISILLAVLQAFTYAVPFSDTQQFLDLSTYNFHVGRSFVYKYVLTVSLYLFQNNVKQYSIKVYDGTDERAPEISTEGKIPQNDKSVEYPKPITSTTGNMYIVLSADNTDAKARVDFQAMVTDHAQPAECGNLVISINKSNNATIFELPAKCQYVFHANDPGNNPFLTQNIQNGLTLNSDQYTVYKGLKTDIAHKLVNNKLMTYIQASDKYLVFNTNQDITFTHYWYMAAGYVITTPVGIYTHGSVMTVDYLQDEYPDFFQGFQQDFLIRRITPVTAIQITYYSLLGSGSLTVTPFMNGSPTAQPVIYTPTQFYGPFNVTYINCDQIQLTYTTPDRPGGIYTGFYGLISDASDNKILPSTSTPTTTTTTKATGTVSNVFSVSVLMVALFFNNIISLTFFQ